MGGYGQGCEGLRTGITWVWTGPEVKVVALSLCFFLWVSMVVVSKQATPETIEEIFKSKVVGKLELAGTSRMYI